MPLYISTMSYKDQGNGEYKKGNWLKAAALYTKGIKEDPENAVLYRCHVQSSGVSCFKIGSQSSDLSYEKRSACAATAQPPCFS